MKPINLTKLEKNCDHLIHQINKKSAFELESNIYFFIQENFTLCNKLVTRMEFQACIFIYKIVANLLVVILRSIIKEDCPLYPVKTVLIFLVDENQDETVEIFNNREFVVNQDSIQHKDPKYTFFLDKILRFSVLILNNMGVLDTIHGNFIEGIKKFLRVFQLREIIINSNLALFHLGIISLNAAHCYQMNNNFEPAGEAVQLAELFLQEVQQEIIGFSNKYSHQEAKYHGRSIVERSTDLFVILELLANQSSTQFIEEYPDPEPKIYRLLELTYFFEFNIYQLFGRQEEAEQAREYSQQMLLNLQDYIDENGNEYKKAQVQQKEKYQQTKKQQIWKNDNENLELADPILSKENIIYQKFVDIKNVKYKIIFVQVPEHDCIQVLFYSQPKNFLRKLIIGFSSIIDYAKELEMPSIDNDKELKRFLALISNKLYIKNGELYIKEIEFYHNLDDYLKFKKTEQFQKL